MYTITSNGGDLGPDFNGYREYWQKSFDGAYVSFYDQGVASGKADLEAQTYDGLDDLDAVEVTQRGAAWEAQVDGYRYTTRERGPTKFG